MVQTIKERIEKKKLRDIKYRNANKDKIKAYQLSIKDKLTEYKKQWAKDNQDKIKSYTLKHKHKLKEYQQSNPIIMKANHDRYRLNKLSNIT